MQTIFGMILVYLVAYYVPTAFVRVFDANTKLGYFEDEVTGVSVELMRRSPELRKNFDEFRECMKNSNSCNLGLIFEERNRIIAQSWPAVFDRVSVRSDWWSLADQIISPSKADQKEIDQSSFFEELRKRGTDTLRNRCVPNTHYLYSGGGATYDTAGFTCQPDRKRSG